MYCHNCGKKISDNVKFCTGCGKPTDRKDNDAASSGDVSDNQTKKPHGVEDSTTAVFITVFVVVIAIVGLILWASVSSSTGDQNASADSITSEGNNMYYFPYGSFAAYFPTSPTFATSTQNLTAQNSVLDNNYYSTDNSGTYILEEVTYIKSAFSNPDTAKENLKDEISYNTGSGSVWSLISSKLTTYDGLDAVSYTEYSKSDGYYGIGRDTERGNDLYMVEYYYKSGAENKTLENSFLNSLQFGDESSIFSQDSAEQNTNQPQQEIQTIQSSQQQSEAQTVQTTQSSPTVGNSDQVSPSTESLSSSLINQIEPAIVEINCWSGQNSSTLGTSGSGEVLVENGNMGILSNYHVYAEAYTGTEPPTCYATFPEPPNFSDNPYYGDYQINLTAYKYNPDTYQDEALFVLGAPPAVPCRKKDIVQQTPVRLNGG